MGRDMATRRRGVIVHDGEGAVPLTVAPPGESEAAAVAAELRSLARDICLPDTLGA